MPRWYKFNDRVQVLEKDTKNSIHSLASLKIVLQYQKTCFDEMFPLDDHYQMPTIKCP